MSFIYHWYVAQLRLRSLRTVIILLSNQIMPHIAIGLTLLDALHKVVFPTSQNLIPRFNLVTVF